MSQGLDQAARVKGTGGRWSTLSLGLVLGLGTATMACGGGYQESGDGYVDADESTDDAALASDAMTGEGNLGELGTSQEGFSFFSRFSSASSCSDSKGTNSVMAALAVATGTELRRWQPTKDFQSSNGVLKLTSTGRAQCADGVCWNTQAILDLQNAPAGKVQVRPGVTLDPNALRSGLTANLVQQLFSFASAIVPEHKLQLMYSVSGGCDQYYWFNVTTPTGGLVSSFLTSTLDEKLKWVGGDKNPYIQFETNGTLVGVDPTYGLNEVGSSAAGSCSSACTKMSSSDIGGSCCSCNGTKKFARSAWSTSTYICQ